MDKKICQINGQTGIQLFDLVDNTVVKVENIVVKEEIARYKQHFQKLYIVNVSKWVTME